MKNASLFLLGLIVICSCHSKAQMKTAISSVVVPNSDFENTMPTYTKGGISGFYKYLSSEVMPLMSKETGRNSSFPPTKLKMRLYINERGDITDVGFPDESLTKDCENKMKAKLLTLNGWKAPVVGGRPIKSTFLCGVNCILWQ